MNFDEFYNNLFSFSENILQWDLEKGFLKDKLNNPYFKLNSLVKQVLRAENHLLLLYEDNQIHVYKYPEMIFKY